MGNGFRALLSIIACLAIADASAGVNAWTSLGPPLNDVQALAINPADHSEMYIASEIDPIHGPSAVSKSTDGGQHWTTVFTPPVPATGPAVTLRGIVIDPVHPSTVYAVGDQPVSFGAPLYKSIDSGATWALKNVGLLSLIDFHPAIDPVIPTTLYAASRDGVYRTLDGGDTWALIPGSPPSAFVVLDPSAHSTIYAGVAAAAGLVGVVGVGVMRSTDGGDHWNPVGQPISHMQVFQLLFDPSDAATLYAVGETPPQPDGYGPLPPSPDYGLYKTTDGGTSWTNVSLGGVFSTGIQSGVPDGLALVSLVAVPTSPTTFFSVGWECHVYRSLTAGATWSDVSAGLPDGSCPRALVNPGDPATVYDLANDGIYEYTLDEPLVPPECVLTATPAIISVGDSATLSTSCMPAPTSYVWSANSGLASTDAGGTVTPTQSTTYTVQGVGPGGAGPVSSATVLMPSPRLAALSTRMQVSTGDGVVIGGFGISGTASKTVVIRARGPSLASQGVTNFIANPVLQLMGSNGLIATNDEWGTAPNVADIIASGFAPSDPHESAIMMNLPSGLYTAVVSSADGTPGVGIVEVMEVDHPELPLAAISTRGNVLTGDDVMIGGFIVQGSGPQTVIIRARGPSLAAQGVSGALANPVLHLLSGTTEIASNDDWVSSPDAAAIQAAGFAPANSLESAILVTLNPGPYTAVVTGQGGATGIGIVEVFAQ
jgi:photosystem II stability/assembly factor-like uncharacterized protein